MKLNIQLFAENKLVIETEVDSTGFEEGLEELPSIAEKKGKKTGNIFTKFFSKSFNKIGDIGKKALNGFLGISSSLLKTTGYVLKITSKLGILGVLLGGVALAGMGIAYSFEKAIEKDEELEVKAKYLGFALKSIFEGTGGVLVNVFNWLLDRLYDIFAILGGIIKLITGFNIFAKATADNFKSANKSAGSLKKTLAGFDEMNVLNQSGGTGLLGDLSSNIDQIRDLSAETENMAQKIKRWFLGGDTLKEGLENSINIIKNNFAPIVDWFEKNLITPIKGKVDDFIEYTKPLWEPIEKEFKIGIDKMIADFQPLIDYIQPNVIEPIKSKVVNFKDKTLQIFAPFFNKIIKWINETFGIFGVKLDYIEYKSDKTGDGIEENIGGALDDVQKKADNLSKKSYKVDIIQTALETAKGWLDDIFEDLKDLTSKTWKIVTSFVSGGASKGTQNSWLDPIRNALAKIGINLPKLAQGGIINMPGRGVPVGSAIGGESGPEGVIPLTDSQQMSLLGEAIGKYINVNATIPVYVGNRQIARELRKINAEDDFAYNG